MTLSTQPYKGTRDFYPEDQRLRKWFFGRMRAALEGFGYQEYDGPMLEPFELYAAKTGEEIVNQQLYWLVDRGDRKLAIRPEMTPTLARMVAARIHELPRPIRWYSIPNLWRYERPQRGRLREHWQVNVDVLGGDPILADAEILSVAHSFMKAFGGEGHVSIRVNHRGLVDEVLRARLGLEPSKSLAVTKAIDARAKIGEEAYAKWLADLGLAPPQRETLERFFRSSLEQATAEFPGPGASALTELFRLLSESGVPAEFDPTVIRGLDYYTGTVFEVYDRSPENRRAMFGGGRYDNLVGLFGKDVLPGVGFGMGDVTLQNFLEAHGLLPKLGASIDLFVTLPRLELRERAEGLARSARDAGLSAVVSIECGGFGAQLKQASRLGARFCALLGDEELSMGRVRIKHLATGVQEDVIWQDTAAWLLKRSQSKESQ